MARGMGWRIAGATGGYPPTQKSHRSCECGCPGSLTISGANEKVGIWSSFKLVMHPTDEAYDYGDIHEQPSLYVG